MHILNDIKYEDDIVLMAETERKFQELIGKVVKGIRNKVLSINCKETEYEVVVSKRNCPRYDI